MKLNLLLSLVYSLPIFNFKSICTTEFECEQDSLCDQIFCNVIKQLANEYLRVKSEPENTCSIYTTITITNTYPNIYPTTDDCTDIKTIDTTTTDDYTDIIDTKTIDTTTTDDYTDIIDTKTVDTTTVDTTTTDTTTTDTTTTDTTITDTTTTDTTITDTTTTDTTTTDTTTTDTTTTDMSSIIYDVYVSFYGFDDNDNGSGTFGVSTISNPVIHQYATESNGTYNSPNTFASDQLFRIFNVGDIIYIPKFRKYYILEDTCVECTGDQNSGKIHVDLYIGGNTKLEGQSLIDCENSLDTGGFNTVVIKNPKSNLPVNHISFYEENTQVCNNLTF